MRYRKDVDGAYLLETYVQNFGHILESTHDGIELISLRSPHLNYRIQGRIVDLRPESLLVLNAQDKHAEFHPSQLRSHYRSMTISAELSQKVLKDENLKASEIIFKPVSHLGLGRVQ